MTRTALLSFMLATTALVPACAQGDVDTTDKEAIEQIVHDYIVEHPEVIEEALIKLSQKADERDAAAKRDAIADNQDALYNHEGDYSIGPEDAEVTVVEFFDYRCGFCKRSLEWATGLPEAYDGKVRIILKDFPILSPESEKAALAALAAGEQGKYAEMHKELMQLDNASGFDPEDIDEAAERAGVDVAKMREDMELLRLQKVIADNKSLGRKLGVDGTPAFFVGEKHVVGANQAAVDDAIEAALEGEAG
ncbi:DsbA family protein [Henriciella aquimarina]|uniref:DsbA family protein n=1 Tax=Henriciella aquimarina TaxID=545261 RepID=UPI0009FC61F0|nr:thioredoxin domain-containing protein [Henriciella aquimarina]